MTLTSEELGEWYIKLQDVGGVHNINLVTPEHVVPQVVLSILHARDLGLHIPIIYNTSSFDSLTSIELLDGLVDIYLADFKVWSTASSKRLLKADDYAAEARKSIKAMHDQVGDLCFTSDGLAKRGLLIRHLVMPGLEAEGASIVGWLADEIGPDVAIHVMEQYAPRAHVGKSRRGEVPRTQASTNTGEQIMEPGGAAASAPPAKEVRYADINRAVQYSEVDSVQAAAEKAGLWRFITPAEHSLFHI